MTKNLVCTTLILCSLLQSAAFMSCGHAADGTAQQDTIQYISADFFEDADTMPHEAPAPKKKKKSRNVREVPESSHQTTPTTIQKKQTPPPTTNTPSDLTAERIARALQTPVIRMVYPDAFQKAKSRVLDSDLSGNRWTIELEISWSDAWVKSPYTVRGIAKCNADGDDVSFDITFKNEAAEALELTHEQYKSSIRLARLPR